MHALIASQQRRAELFPLRANRTFLSVAQETGRHQCNQPTAGYRQRGCETALPGVHLDHSNVSHRNTNGDCSVIIRCARVDFASVALSHSTDGDTIDSCPSRMYTNQSRSL